MRRVFAIDATASMNRASLAFAWSAPTLNCVVAISIAISKTPTLPRSWHAPSAWTPSVACAHGSQQPLEGAVLDAACSAYVEAAVEQMDQQVKGCGRGTRTRWQLAL